MVGVGCARGTGGLGNKGQLRALEISKHFFWRLLGDYSPLFTRTKFPCDAPGARFGRIRSFHQRQSFMRGSLVSDRPPLTVKTEPRGIYWLCMIHIQDGQHGKRRSIRQYSCDGQWKMVRWKSAQLWKWCHAPSTVHPLARDSRVLLGWPLPLGFGLDGCLLLVRRGRVYSPASACISTKWRD